MDARIQQTPFFISYAHTGPESDEMAKRFYHVLRGHIQTLVHVPVGTALGFFDQDGIDPAVLWDEELAEALGTCQVMVALLSPPYLNREWCGKEWHAFTLREPEPLPGADPFAESEPDPAGALGAYTVCCSRRRSASLNSSPDEHDQTAGSC